MVRRLLFSWQFNRLCLSLNAYDLERAQLRAPFESLVVSGDLSQSIGAPVERGKVLFEVAPLDAYRVILEVDERDIAEVADGQEGHLVLSAFPNEPLPFTVHSLPRSPQRARDAITSVSKHAWPIPQRAYGRVWRG